MWAENPGSASIRAAIARVVIFGSDAAVAELMRKLFEIRGKLGLEFEQTETLVVHDVVERNRHTWARALDGDPARYPEWIEREVADFAAGYSRILPTDWLAVRHPQIPMPYGHSFRFEKRTTRQNYGMDFDRVVAAFGWIPLVNEAASPAEREEWSWRHREILRCLLGTFPTLAEGSEEYEGLPYQVDRQVLATSAQLALELTDHEDHAAFWQPVLALGAAAHPWVADFIRGFLIPALETPTPPAHFARRWKTMVEFAESSPEWQAGGTKPWEREKLWLNLMGIEPLLSSCWQPQHRAILLEVWPNVERWAQTFLKEDDSLRAFLHFMRQPVVAEWISNALILVDQAFASRSADSFDEDFPENQLARFLVFVHEQHARTLGRTGKAYEIFVSLVTKLAAAQNRIALELQSRLAG
jgi:hypothetical protein